MGRVVPLREFARLQGWNPGYAHKLKMQGRLVAGVDERDREGIDIEASLERLAETADPAKTHMAEVNAQQRARHRSGEAPPPSPTPAPSGNSTYHQAKTAREVFEAKTAEIEYRKAAGELARVADLRAAHAPRVAALREALLGVSARLSPVLANESDPKKIRAMLDEEHRAALALVAALTTEGAAP